MIRGMTLLWAGLALSVGCGVFLVKHQVQDLENDLRAINRAIADHHAAIHMARAEWAFRSAPDRLSEQAARHLDLGPVNPARITTLAALPWRRDLPPATAHGRGEVHLGAATPSIAPWPSFPSGKPAGPSGASELAAAPPAGGPGQ